MSRNIFISIGLLLGTVMIFTSCVPLEKNNHTVAPSRAEIISIGPDTWEIKLQEGETAQPEITKTGPNTWQIDLHMIEQVDDWEWYPQNLPGCDKVKEWQWLLQHQAAEDDGFQLLSYTEIALCLYCPGLAEQLGVTCTGVCIDFPPQSTPAQSGSENSSNGYCGSSSGSEYGGGMKGYDCIAKCKQVYQNCMKGCVDIPGITGESFMSCDIKCIGEESKCLDSCLGK